MESVFISEIFLGFIAIIIASEGIPNFVDDTKKKTKKLLSSIQHNVKAFKSFGLEGICSLEVWILWNCKEISTSI